MKVAKKVVKKAAIAVLSGLLVAGLANNALAHRGSGRNVPRPPSNSETPVPVPCNPNEPCEQFRP